MSDVIDIDSAVHGWERGGVICPACHKTWTAVFVAQSEAHLECPECGSVGAQLYTPPQPFLKWVGGKRRLLPELDKRFPKDLLDRSFYDPFVGAGAVTFHIYDKFVRAWGLVDRYPITVSDANLNLVGAYRGIRRDVSDVIGALAASENDPDFFQRVRAINPDSLSDTRVAWWMIYLNKTCFNGLYRVNKQGRFNVPFGKYKNPKILDELNLRAVSDMLKRVAHVQHRDFEEALSWADPGRFFYLDPPYDSDAGGFTGYTGDGFGKRDQARLAVALYQADQKGAKWMLSNADTPFVRQLYTGFVIEEVSLNHVVGAQGPKAAKELIIRNYTE